MEGEEPEEVSEELSEECLEVSANEEGESAPATWRRRRRFGDHSFFATGLSKIVAAAPRRAAVSLHASVQGVALSLAQ